MGRRVMASGSIGRAWWEVRLARVNGSKKGVATLCGPVTVCHIGLGRECNVENGSCRVKLALGTADELVLGGH